MERMIPSGCMAIAGQRSFMKNVWPRTDKYVQRDELVVIDIGGEARRLPDGHVAKHRRG